MGQQTGPDDLPENAGEQKVLIGEDGETLFAIGSRTMVERAP